MKELQERILSLKKEKNALILAHYYQTKDILDIADYVSDSFDMARHAANAEENLLIICGVRFMAESAKILNPDKTVLLPSANAGCPMVNMITPQDITALRSEYPDAAVVCYVNSSAALKAVCDICCTSSSAVKIVKSLPEKRIIFVPDRNLGAYIASKAPDKEIILFHGFCPVHDCVSEKDVFSAKNAYPGAKLLVHPECRWEVIRHADYVGSTEGIINEAINSAATEFIIGTDNSVAEHLQAIMPEKRFHPLKNSFLCADMKKTRLSDILHSLEIGGYEITLGADEIVAAKKSLQRMFELG